MRLFKVRGFSERWPLWLLAPGAGNTYIRHCPYWLTKPATKECATPHLCYYFVRTLQHAIPVHLILTHKTHHNLWYIYCLILT